jgi:hypothetical protein
MRERDVHRERDKTRLMLVPCLVDFVDVSVTIAYITGGERGSVGLEDRAAHGLTKGNRNCAAKSWSLLSVVVVAVVLMYLH